MKKLSIAGFLLSGLLVLSATASVAQSSEEIRQIFDENVGVDKELSDYYRVWDPIAEADIAWKKRVWRSIDLAQVGNEFFNLTSVHPSLVDVLFNGVEQGAFQAYNADDDHFTTVLSPEAMRSLRATVSSGPKKIVALNIKEDWLYVISKKKMVVRIVGIAPVFAAEEGREAQAAFWVFYPYIREYMQKQPIAAPETHPNTLDEVFEGRFFKSKIEKVSGPAE